VLGPLRAPAEPQLVLEPSVVLPLEAPRRQTAVASQAQPGEQKTEQPPAQPETTPPPQTPPTAALPSFYGLPSVAGAAPSANAAPAPASSTNISGQSAVPAASVGDI